MMRVGQVFKIRVLVPSVCCRVAVVCRLPYVRVSFLNNARGLKPDIFVSSLPDFSFADQTFFFAASMIRRA